VVTQRDSGERAAMSARFPVSVHRWMSEQADAEGIPTNDYLVRAIEDLRSCFGLPRAMADRLDEDRKALGLGPREYVLHLLTRRYEQLLTNKPGFDRKQSKP
jgi:hypothetical protein